MYRVALAIDVALIEVFVLIGRHAHGHGLDLGGVVSTSWPFQAGLGCGWALVMIRHSSPRRLTTGVVLSVITVVVAMALRMVSGQGTTPVFVVVALVFVDLFLVGWRALAHVLDRGSSRPR